MLLSSPSLSLCPAPLRCARTFCRRSRYLSKEPALVLNNTRVPTKLLCPLRRHRGWTPHRRPCPLWKITSTVFPASVQIPWRVRRSISSDNRSQREKSSGLEFRTICLILLVPLPHSWSGKSEAGRARPGSRWEYFAASFDWNIKERWNRGEDSCDKWGSRTVRWDKGTATFSSLLPRWIRLFV